MKLSEQLQRHFRAPALDLRDGRTVEGELGDTHADLMAGLSDRDKLIQNIGHGFVDHNSNFHSREDARLFLRRRGVDMPDQPNEGPSSEMLRGDFDQEYPEGYPQKVRGDVAPDQKHGVPDSVGGTTVWFKSGQRTLHRFPNGYGASFIGPDDQGKYEFAPVKYTDDPQSPFFIHYATPVGPPRQVSEHEIHPLTVQMSQLTDEGVNAYMKKERLLNE